jgi:type VI secretion system protein VasG
MGEHLFGYKNALLKVNLNENYHSIDEVKVINDKNDSVNLLATIQKAPYSVILIENIQQATAATFALFKSILMQGMAIDKLGRQYDFRHAIVVVTTTLGAEKIISLTQTTPVYETNKTLDLMQLVLNDHPHQIKQPLQPHLSAQELCEELAPILEGYFSSALLQCMNIIPFVPLDYSALEKIVRSKIKDLGKHLDANFNTELNYAPEVVKFLAHELLWRKQARSFDKLLEQHLYSAVASEMLAYAEENNRPKRLLLQLNDDGQLLRCEFIGAVGTPLYNHAL